MNTNRHESEPDRGNAHQRAGSSLSGARGVAALKRVFKSNLKAFGRGFDLRLPERLTALAENGENVQHSTSNAQRPKEELVGASNEEAVSDEEEIVVSSGLCEAANERDGWVRIARYGDWPHPRGLQRFTRESAETMAGIFNSSVARVTRALGFGAHKVKGYVGHPDDPVFANTPGHDDTTEYFHGVAMEARDDGIYLRRAWTNEGEPVKDKLPKKFSPRWGMRPLGNGVFEPIKLISVGLTDSPNIPDASNQKRTTEKPMKELFKKIMKRLGYTDTQIEAAANATAEAPKEEEVLGKVDAALSASNSVDATKTELATANESLKTEKTAREKAESDLTAAREDAQRHQTAFSNERKARIGLVLDDAVSNAKITEADRSTWERRLNDASDFDGEVTALSKQTTSFSNAGKPPKTEGLGARNATQEDGMRQFRDAVEERCEKKNESWAVAWANCKKDRKLSQLLDAVGEEAGV